MAKFFMRVCVSVLLCTMILSVLPVHGEEGIYEQVVRLHVLANSDSEKDQALKYQVRDALLEQAGELFANCTDAKQAEQVAKTNLPYLEQIAQTTLKQAGSDQSCVVTVSREEYPTRDYGTFSFPAGTYVSLRVLIGQAAGQNWWCVLFPPLCLDAASETYVGNDAEYDEESGEVMYRAGFSPSQVDLVTGNGKKKTIVKFRLLEFFSSLFS